MANQYPTAANAYATGASSPTLASAGHSSAHNALELKLGTGATTPTASTVLRGTGTGTSAWAQVDVTTDVTGALPVANGGTGATTLTGILLGAGTSAITALSSSGTGNVARVSSPTFTTPTLGAALATSLNGLIITTTTGTITLTNGKTLTVSDSTTLATNAITLGGGEVITFSASNALSLLTTGTSVMTFPTATDTVTTLAATQTVTNKRVTKRAPAVTQSATPTINTDVTDVAHITALAQAITSMTTNLSGTPVEGDTLRIDITDNGTARAITWGAKFESSGNVTLPTTTVLGVRLDVGFIWNTVTTAWRCCAVA